MAKVILIGGAGFIGYHLADTLHASGHEVVVFDNFTLYHHPLGALDEAFISERHRLLNNIATIIRGDACDCALLVQVILDHEPSHLVHLAGAPLVAFSNKQVGDAYSSIVGSTTAMLRATQLAKPFAKPLEKVVFISSSTVYGDFESPTATETHPTAPKEVYGGAKLAGEILVQSFAQRFGLPFVIVRPSAVYGPFDINRRVVRVFMESALCGKILRVEDPQTTLDFTYVTDVARGIAAATFSPRATGQVFNITCGNGRTLYELVEILKKHAPGITAEFVPGNAELPKRGTLSIAAAESMLGYQPRFSLEDGIAQYIRHFAEFLADQRRHRRDAHAQSQAVAG